MHNTGHFDVDYAGFPRRLLALCLDSLLVSALSSIVVIALFGMDHLVQLHQATNPASIDWQATAIEQAISAAWCIGFWAWWMATPGKQLFDCQVVDATTLGKPSLGRLVIRYIGYIVSLLPLGLGFLWIVFDRRRQGWHDKMANTLVIMQDASLFSAVANPGQAR
jgi:uncharacterized RDD family membrane protein YckC